MVKLDDSKLTDFRYYASNLLKIKTEKREILPLLFNVEQERLHKTWEWQLKQTGMVRVIILKDRRIGASTYVEGRLFHQAVTTPNTSAYIITHDKPSLAKIFNMSKLFFESLPSAYRPMKRYSNKVELVFENPDEKKRFIDPGLRSSIEVFSANTGTASRSGGYSVGHFSEVAFYENAEELITSTVPSIQDLPGTVKVYESTGNGRSGFFYDQWQKAKKSLTAKRKLSNFFPLFFGWLTFPEYSKPFSNPKERKNFSETMDEEEVYLQKKFGASLEQLNWRRTKILDFDGDEDKFHQEYPADDQEAFISKGTPYWSKKVLLHLRNFCKPPKWIGEIGEFALTPHEDGRLKIWEEPEKGMEYILASDSGEGVSGGDFSTIEVLRVPKGTPIIKQVAEWKGLIDPVMFAGVIANLGTYYNEGMAAPEAKHPGLSTIIELKDIYSNIYQWQYFDRYKNTMGLKLGWETNIATKPHACNYLSACLVADILEINSEELIDEMLSFIRNTSNSGEADFQCHDDLIMAYMIGVFVTGKNSQVGSLLQQMGQFKEKREEVRKAPTLNELSMDRDFWMPSHEMVDAGDTSWLNY